MVLTYFGICVLNFALIILNRACKNEVFLTNSTNAAMVLAFGLIPMLNVFVFGSLILYTIVNYFLVFVKHVKVFFD